MLVFGFVLLALSAVFLMAWRSEARKLRLVRATETWTARQLVDFVRSVRQELEALGQWDGFFGRIVAVTGVIKCDSPLISEVTQQPCVYHDTSVVRKYRRRSEVVAKRSRSAPFWLEDSTGRVLVDPAGASVDGLQVANEFEPAVGEAVQVGETTLHLAGPVSRSQPLGQRVREKILPIDRTAYVLGEVGDSPDGPVIRKPRDGSAKLVISLKSEDELTQSTEARLWQLAALALATGSGGAVLTALSLAS